MTSATKQPCISFAIRELQCGNGGIERLLKLDEELAKTSGVFWTSIKVPCKEARGINKLQSANSRGSGTKGGKTLTESGMARGCIKRKEWGSRNATQ